MKYFIHLVRRAIQEPKKLLDYRYYLMKIRFHFWPLVPKFLKKNIFIFGKKINIETDTFNGRGIYSYRNLKDLNERKLIESQVNTNSICIDIGSNIGFYTIFLFKIINAKKVYAFELKKKTFNLLLKNTAEYNCIQIQGEVGINNNQIIVDNSVDAHEKVDFIKIDIDGLDYFALKSCEKIIYKYKPKILIEISESSERLHGINFLKVIEYLKTKNYECFYADTNLKKFDRKTLNKDEVINIFFK